MESGAQRKSSNSSRSTKPLHPTDAQSATREWPRIPQSSRLRTRFAGGCCAGSRSGARSMRKVVAGWGTMESLPVI
jgi:hypothetical protein